MKKLILSLIATKAIVFVTRSQVFILTDVQDANINGDTVLLSACSTTSYFVHVKNNSGTARTVKVKKRHIEIVAGTQNYFCWVNCYAPGVFVSSQSFLMQPGYTTSGAEDLSCDYTNTGNTGTSIIAYTVYDVDNAADSSVFYIKFACTNGIDDNAQSRISEAYPNPANTSAAIDYSLNKTHDSRIVLFNLPGVQVASYNPDKTTGKIIINTAALPSGTYFYSFITDNKIAKSGILVVSH